MKPLSFMLIAGDPSGDLLTASLVNALREKTIARSQDLSRDAQPLRTALAPRFFGAGGPQMAAAGVELCYDMMKHTGIGISEFLKNVGEGRRVFKRLLALAIDRQPDVIIGVDYGFFNLRFCKAVKDYVRKHRSDFQPWNPKIVQFVSPQVWASRPHRAQVLEENHDLLLSIFPFEKGWYAKRAPRLRVEFVGHPMVGKISEPREKSLSDANGAAIALLPGSRPSELRRHMPVILATFELMRKEMPHVRGKMVLPNAKLLETARSAGTTTGIELQVGGLSEVLAQSDLAITKSGTVTMECALAGLPAVVFYITSWATYMVFKPIINIKYIAMPNLLADEEVFPEFVQHKAKPESIARAALDLLRNAQKRKSTRAKLASIVGSLGGPGAADAAANAILSLLP